MVNELFWIPSVENIEELYAIKDPKHGWACYVRDCEAVYIYCDNQWALLSDNASEEIPEASMESIRRLLNEP